MEQQRSSWAVGFAMFAAVMLMIGGSFQVIAGLAGIFENEFYLTDAELLPGVRRVRMGMDRSLLWGVLVLIGALVCSTDRSGSDVGCDRGSREACSSASR